MSLAKAIVAARKKKGLTQEELANLTNITARTIQRIESGETSPRAFTVKTIAAALDTNFEELHTTTADELIAPTVSKINFNRAINIGDTRNFLQLFCLSCFSYLVLPFIYFLIPIYLFGKRKEQNALVLAFARRVIRVQIYWLIALNLLLLLTVAYNIFCKVYLNSSLTTSYLVPFFTMYAVNALIIFSTLMKAKKINL